MAIFRRNNGNNNNNSRVELPPAFTSQEQTIQHIKRVNSLLNEQMGIGYPDNDPLERLGTIEKQYSGSTARHIYRSLDIVQRIIDSPAKDAVRNGFKLKTNFDDYGLNEALLKRFEDLKYKEKFEQFLINSRLYSRGALLMPVIREANQTYDRGHLRRPINFRNLEKIDSLNLVQDDHFNYWVQHYDPFAAGFNEIEFLDIHGQSVDKSRVHLYVNSLDPYRQRGVSTLERITTACMGLNIAEWTISNLLLRYRALLVKYPSKEIHNMNETKKAFLQGLLNDIKNKFTSKSVASVPDNYEFEYLQTNLTGMREATDFLYSYLASVTNVPQSIIKGSAQGELASAEKDQRDYYELIQSEEQGAKLTNLINFLTKFLLYEKSGPVYDILLKNNIAPQEVNSKPEFEPLQSVNPMQDAQIGLINAQRYSIEIDRGISNPEQAQREIYPEREEFAGGGSDIIDDDEPPFDLSEFMKTFDNINKN